jgi:hypothetical protein
MEAELDEARDMALSALRAKAQFLANTPATSSARH